MALSGMMGKVYYIDNSCPTVDCSQFSTPSGGGTCWFDQVTKFTVVDSVQKKEFGHDKSEGWQDVCAGTRKAAITLDAMIVPGSSRPALPNAGKVLYLKLYPIGEAGGATPAAGYALVDQISYTYDQERGDPIAYSATLSSKGPWTGLGGTAWGGFECLTSGE